MNYLDINSWKRKEHFEFFKDFKEPFFGIVTDINCTNAYKLCKEKKISFFAYYLHKSLKTVNEIEEFKYRIDGNKIIICDKIHAAATIGRPDNTFAFTFIEFIADFKEFNIKLQAEIKRVQQTPGLFLYQDKTRKDVIHYSSTPWLNFKGLTHARNHTNGDSTPLIVFGKLHEDNGKFEMPVAINAHHALMDAYHVSQYYKKFEEELNT